MNQASSSSSTSTSIPRMLTISSTLRLGTRHALHHHRLLPAAVLAPSSPSKQNTLDAFLGMPPKRSRSPTAAGPGPSPSKKPKSKSSSPSKAQVEQGRKNAQGDLGDRATAQELKEDEGIGINERGETPYDELKRTLKEYSKKGSDDAETVVHWMRFKVRPPSAPLRPELTFGGHRTCGSRTTKAWRSLPPSAATASPART